MGTEQPKEFYDHHYQSTPVPHPLVLRIYHDAAIRMTPESRILDIGCGDGNFAVMLDLYCPYNPQQYWGVDFSKTAIGNAAQRSPRSEFSIKDFGDGFVFEAYNTFILFEVLEHIEKDVDLIKMLPSGATVFITVPSFDWPAHVRYFENRQEVIKRYQDFIEFEFLDVFQATENDFFFYGMGFVK